LLHNRASASPAPGSPDYTLEHKYTRTEGRIYLSGVQALVRLPLMQKLRDAPPG
jgi:indolepyruvate ferredoxin oxidoreductase